MLGEAAFRIWPVAAADSRAVRSSNLRGRLCPLNFTRPKFALTASYRTRIGGNVCHRNQWADQSGHAPPNRCHRVTPARQHRREPPAAIHSATAISAAAATVTSLPMPVAPLLGQLALTA